MKVIKNNGQSTTVELDRGDIQLLLNVLLEFTSGPYALTNQDDWDMVMSFSKEEVSAMRENFSKLLDKNP